MPKPTLKRETILDVYDGGIEEGRIIAQEAFSEEDQLLDVALEGFNDRDRRTILKMDTDDLITIAKNFHDGLEDGFKVELGKITSELIKNLRREL